MGNTRIKVSDFWDKADLNLNGLPQKQSPIALFTRAGNVPSVEVLIELGVTERPIDYLFLGIHPSHFMGCDLLEIDKFKARISNNLASTGFSDSLEDQCQVGALLLSHPTSELEAVFAKDKEHLYYNMRFLSLFAWAAKNDRADLLDIFHFKKLFQEDRSSAKEAIVIAAAFGSIKFLTKAIQYGLLEKEDIQKACSVAAANGDNELLTALIKLSLGSSEENNPSQTRKVSGIYYFESFNTPLFWAVRNAHKDTVELLLNAGVSPNGYQDDFAHDSYLKLAVRCNNIEIIKLLITHGANINHQSIFGYSALHDAVEENNLEIIKILITAGADVNLADKEGYKPLEKIKDEAVRKELEQFIIERDKTQNSFINLLKKSFFSTSISNVSSTTDLSEQNRPK